MFRASGRRDCHRAIASVHSYLATKQLRVQSIDHVNTGLDCLHNTVRIGVVAEPAYTLRGLIDGQLQPVVPLQHMTPNQMKNATANTVTWLLNTSLQGYSVTKEVLRYHIDVEARVYLGPRGSNRSQVHATFQEGSILKATMFASKNHMCHVALDAHPKHAS
jgi:hypothetical protein